MNALHLWCFSPKVSYHYSDSISNFGLCMQRVICNFYQKKPWFTWFNDIVNFSGIHFSKLVVGSVEPMELMLTKPQWIGMKIEPKTYLLVLCCYCEFGAMTAYFRDSRVPTKLLLIFEKKSRGQDLIWESTYINLDW